MTAERDDRDLNRFWNEVAAGDPGTAGDVDPEDARLVRHLHTLANAPLPVSARERVWHGLLDTYLSRPESKDKTMLTASDLPRNAGYRNGRVGPIQTAPTPSRPFPVLTRPIALALAAALVLGLIGGMGAAWRFTSWGESGPSRGGPAIYAPGTPSTDATPTDEPLAVATTPTAVEGMAAEFEGTWLVTASTDGQITRHVVALTADGVAIVNGMPAQPLPGGESGAALVSTCLGAWEPSSTNTANITCVRYRASAEGQPLGTVTVSMNITSGFFNTTAGEGTGVATVVDAEGNTVATIVSGLTITKLFAQAPVIPYPDETPST